MEHDELDRSQITEEAHLDASAASEDRVASTLRLIAFFLLICVVAVGLGLVWYLRGFGAPRTAAERDIATYTAAAMENPSVLGNHLRLAYAYAEADRLQDAEEALSRARALSTSSVVELADAEILRVSDSPEEAIAAYELAISKARVEYDAAVAEMKARNITSPIDQSTLTRAHYGKALSLWALGRRDDAISSLRNALQTAPDDASLHTLLGDYLHLTGEDAAAEAAYLEALRFVPQYPQAEEGLRTLREASDE